MPTHIASQNRRIAPGATKIFFLDCGGRLRTDELLTGTPTVTEITTADLTITGEGRNSAIEEINGRDAAIDEAVTFKVSGAVEGTTYELDIEATTDSNPAQTIHGKLYVKCEKQVAGQEQKTVSEERLIAIDFGREMRTGDLLTGTPTVSVVSGSGLTISSVQKNASDLIINKRKAVASEAVTFLAIVGTAGTTYELLATCSTVDGEVLKSTFYLTVFAD